MAAWRGRGHAPYCFLLPLLLGIWTNHAAPSGLTSPSPPPPPAQLNNGVLVTSTIRLGGANLTALTSSSPTFVQFQTNFKDQLVAAAQATGYTGPLQVSIDSIRAGSVVVSSTTWFQKATTFAQPQTFADTLNNNVASIFAGSSYFFSLPSGQITSTNVTVVAAPSTGGSAPRGKKSSSTSWLIWLLVAVAVLVAIGIGVALYLRCTSKRAQDDYVPGVEDMDEDYDPQAAYAQLVAEAQGYERQNPSQAPNSSERVTIPNIPEQASWQEKTTAPHLPARQSRSQGKGRTRGRATSGPVLFTSAVASDSGPLPGGKAPAAGSLPNDTPVGGAPSRMRNILRSISGPIKVIWPSPGGAVSRAPSGSWSGILTGRWSGRLSRNSSRMFSGPADSTPGTQQSGENGVPDAAGKQRPLSGLLPQGLEGGHHTKHSWTRSLSGTALSELPGIRQLSGQLSGMTNGGLRTSKEAVSPLVDGMPDSAAEPPQPMGLLRSASHRFTEPVQPMALLRSASHKQTRGSQSFGQMDGLEARDWQSEARQGPHAAKQAAPPGGKASPVPTGGERKMRSGPLASIYARSSEPDRKYQSGPLKAPPHNLSPHPPSIQLAQKSPKYQPNGLANVSSVTNGHMSSALPVDLYGNESSSGQTRTRPAATYERIEPSDQADGAMRSRPGLSGPVKLNGASSSAASPKNLNPKYSSGPVSFT